MRASYYHISSAAKELAVPTAGYSASYRERFPCLHRKKDSAINVELAVIGEDVPLTACEVALVGIIRNDLTDALGESLAKHVQLGRVFDNNHNLMDKYRSLGSETRFRLRGGLKSTHCRCPVCDQFLYYPMGEWYFLKSDLTGQPIYYGSGLMMGFIVNEEIYQRLRHRKWPRLYIRRLPILDSPRDGLPHELPD